jgi:type VI secretion system secreted protein VgrG
MGYLVDHKRQKRGEGFELRTSGWGALRAGRGMLISADDQPNANGQQLEMASVQGLLQQALQQTEALAAAAKAAEAVTADYDRQKALLNESLSQLKKAGILISAPAGMALASRTDLQCTAAENLIATAGAHADFSIAKRFTLAAGELVSIFAQKLGIKLLAARGKVELQAQSDEMRLLADKHVTITSANGRVVIEAKDELLLKCGGSYLRMSSTGIEDGTRGDRIIKSAAFSRQGPSSLAQEMNTWKHAKFHDTYVLRNPSTGEPLSNSAIEIVRDDGTRLKVKTDAAGKTPVQKSIFVEPVKIRPLD